MTRAMLGLATTALLWGCATTKPTESRAEVSDLLDERAGVPSAVSAEQDEESVARVRARVAQLLSEPMTLDRALKVAILNNPELSAEMEQLGIAQADLVQAGLLENPVIGGDFIISTKGNGFGGGLSLSQSLLSAFLIPAKRRVAKADLRHAVVDVSHAALTLVRDVKVAYATLQGANARRGLHKKITQAAEVGDELAARLMEAGNITARERAEAGSALDHARLEYAEAQLAVTEAREELNMLLGLWGTQVTWTLGDRLPAVPAAEPDLATIVQRGVDQRLDLSADRFEVASIEYAIKLRRRGVIPMVQAGVGASNEVGNDEGHEWVVGPTLSIELPLFDPGHADFARLRAQLRQAQHELRGRAVRVRSEIRLGRETLVNTRRKVDYVRDTALPRHMEITALTLKEYNAMLVGADHLFEARTEELEARVRFVDALRDYWIARAQLELAVGGKL